MAPLNVCSSRKPTRLELSLLFGFEDGVLCHVLTSFVETIKIHEIISVYACLLNTFLLSDKGNNCFNAATEFLLSIRNVFQKGKNIKRYNEV